MFEVILASVVLVVCVAMLIRMVLSPRIRHRVDSFATRTFHSSRRFVVTTYRWPMAKRKAARMAAEAIHRARRPRGPRDIELDDDDDDRDGNVIKPKSFRRPRKPH